jgi:hypothetical protein
MQEKNNTTMWLIVTVVIIALGVAGFLLLQDNGESDSSDDSTFTFDLNEQNDSGQNGTVTLEEVGESQTRVTITLSNPTTVEEPAHIHTGQCPEPGGVVYPLENVVSGSSTTLLDVTIDELRSEGDLAVNVHKSVAESSVYYSCGDLDL